MFNFSHNIYSCFKNFFLFVHLENAYYDRLCLRTYTHDCEKDTAFKVHAKPNSIIPLTSILKLLNNELKKSQKSLSCAKLCPVKRSFRKSEKKLLIFFTYPPIKTILF